MDTTVITGQLSLVLENGETLTASSDVSLARQWAEHVHGEAWESLTFSEQTEQVAAALASLRGAYGVDDPKEAE